MLRYKPRCETDDWRRMNCKKTANIHTSSGSWSIRYPRTTWDPMWLVLASNVFALLAVRACVRHKINHQQRHKWATFLRQTQVGHHTSWRTFQTTCLSALTGFVLLCICSFCGLWQLCFIVNHESEKAKVVWRPESLIKATRKGKG